MSAVYNGRFRHGVDAKRRVQVPSKWRPVEEGIEFTVIAWDKAAEGICLRVLPPEGLAKLLKAIDEIPNGDPSKVVLKRMLGGNSEQVTLDKAGRLCLPEEMVQSAGIGQQAVLVGLFDGFEIWSPDRYGKVVTSDAVVKPQAMGLVS